MSYARTWFERLPEKLRLPTAAILVALAYYASAKLGLFLSFGPDYVSSFWPPNAVLLSALLLSRPRNWWVFLVAIVPAEVIADAQSGISAARALGFVLADWAEVLIAAFLLRRLALQPLQFDRLRSGLLYLACAVILAPLLAAIPGGAVSTVGVEGASYLSAWRTWALGDAMAHFTVTTFLLLWLDFGSTPRTRFRPGRFLEACALGLGLFAVSYYAFGGSSESYRLFPALLFLPLPFLLWAAVRFGPRGTVSASLFVTLFAIWNASQARGPFASSTPAENVISLQVFLLVSLVPLFLLSIALREQETKDATLKRWAAIVENAQWGIAALSADGSTHEFVNSAYARMHGVAATELEGTSFDSLTMPQGGEEHPLLADRLKDQDFAAYESRHRRADGTAFPVAVDLATVKDEEGSIAYRTLSLRDVSREKEAQEALSLFRALVDRSTDSIFVVDPESGSILDVNETACQSYGFERSEMLALRVLDLDPVELDPEIWQAQSAGMLGAGSVTLEVQHRRQDGSTFPTEISVNTVEVGGSTYFLAVARDVTNRRLLEQQLLHAQRLESVGRLSGGVAHDFNNILTAILGYAGLLREGLDPSSPYQEHVGQILRSGERAARLTQSLLAFSRKQMIRPQPVALNRMVRDAEGLLSRVIGEDVRLAFHLDDRDPWVLADAGQIEQVIMNLATNARDAMPGGGELTIRTGIMEAPPGRSPGAVGEAPETLATLEIADSGAGMDEATRERIFEPFFTTKEVDKGTGLGLAMVYGIVTQHGGTIEVQSEPGSGSLFRIALPVVETEDEQVLEPAALIAPRGLETLLVAEDDPAVAGLMRTVLEQHGYSVILAVDGLEAVELHRQHSDSVSAVILDVVMPNLSGKEALTEIRRRDPGCKAILMSGYVRDGGEAESIEREGLEVLPKPIEAPVLLRRLRQILDS